MSFWSIIFTEASKWLQSHLDYAGKYQNSIQAYIREIISFINSKLSLNSEFLHRTVAYKCDSIVRDVGECAKNSVLRTFVIALPHSVCQKPLLWYSQERMSPFYARYHGWYDNWKVEMHPLSRYSTMRFITLLSFELHSYCFDEEREAICRL